jgi:DNA-binding MarR family transcriptional regulator
MKKREWKEKGCRRWIACLPCTMSELAAVLGITLHQANARLDYAQKQGYVRRIDKFISEKRRGGKARIWVRQ